MELLREHAKHPAAPRPHAGISGKSAGSQSDHSPSPDDRDLRTADLKADVRPVRIDIGDQLHRRISVILAQRVRRTFDGQFRVTAVEFDLPNQTCRKLHAKFRRDRRCNKLNVPCVPRRSGVPMPASSLACSGRRIVRGNADDRHRNVVVRQVFPERPAFAQRDYLRPRQRQFDRAPAAT